MPNGNQLHGGTIKQFTTVDNMAHEIELAYAAVRKANDIAAPLPSEENAKETKITAKTPIRTIPAGQGPIPSGLIRRAPLESFGG